MLGMVRFGADAVFSAEGGAATDDDIEALLTRGEELTRQVGSYPAPGRAC